MFPSTPDAKSMGLLGGPSKASRIPGAPGEPVPAVRCSHVRSELAPGTPLDVSRTCLRKGGVATRVPATPVPPRVFRPHPFRTRRGDSRWTCFEIVWRGGDLASSVPATSVPNSPPGFPPDLPELVQSSTFQSRTWILDSRSSIFGPRNYSTFDIPISTLDAWSSILGLRFSILGPRSTLLDPQSWVLEP